MQTSSPYLNRGTVFCWQTDSGKNDNDVFSFRGRMMMDEVANHFGYIDCRHKVRFAGICPAENDMLQTVRRER